MWKLGAGTKEQLGQGGVRRGRSVGSIGDGKEEKAATSVQSLDLGEQRRKRRSEGSQPGPLADMVCGLAGGVSWSWGLG